MKTIDIKKKSGGTRKIYVPSPDEKNNLRLLVSNIAKKSSGDHIHGFVARRSPVTNAATHRGKAFTTCFDLKDFFDFVTETHLRGKLTKEELAAVMVDGAPRQGLPTSPAVANLAASDLDAAILRWRDKNGLDFVYTRYADDLSFSYDDAALRPKLTEKIPQLVRQCGFTVNDKKTRTMCSRKGRRIITGVAVDGELHPTRATKRRLRAALHQENDRSVRGLREWCLLKMPREKAAEQEEIDKLCILWKLPRVVLSKLPRKQPTKKLSANCVISSDPVYFLGMSTYTSGWTSCTAQPHGKYRRSGLFWLRVKGTRVAMLLSEKTKSFAGVERPVMLARCLVHALENGEKVYDRIYGDNTQETILRRELETAGYKPTSLSGTPVVGGRITSRSVYLDRLHYRNGVLTA